MTRIVLTPTTDGDNPASALGMQKLRAEAEEVAPKNSEDALALEFATEHHHKARFVAAWKQWLVREPHRWITDETNVVQDWVRQLCRENASDAAEREAKQLASAKTVTAVQSLARSDRRLAATTDQWDSDLYVLNTPEGVLDLQTGVLRASRHDDYFTKVTAVGPGGDCQRWLQFINEVTDGDPQLATFLQRVAGYSLTGDTSEHALFFFYGTGANGKSVFLSTLAGILGDYHCAAPIETFTASMGERHPTEVAMLRGARLVTAIETEEGKNWAESRIKALTGGDTVSARFMRKDFFKFKPQFKLLIAGNHKPALRSIDEAIRRRLHLIPFTVTIPPDDREKDLTEKLKAEWPGILRWALDGYLSWRRDGLAPPSSVSAATHAYLEAEDIVGNWITESCTLGAVQDPLATLYASWKLWAERNCEHPRSNRWLSHTLEARGFTSHKAEKGRMFVGISTAPGRNRAQTRAS